MVTYATALAAASKSIAWILDFTGHSNQRYTDRLEYAVGSLITSPATEGLTVTDDIAVRLNLRTGKLDFGEIEVLITDPDGSVATFLATNDNTLRASKAVLKYGFLDVAESEFQVINVLVEGWGRKKGGYAVRLRSVLGFLDAPLFEEFKNDRFTLVKTYNYSDSTLTVGGNLTAAGWRQAGNVLLVANDTDEVGLVAYTSFTVTAENESVLAGLTAQKFNVGASGRSWAAEQTDCSQAWAFRDNPVDVFLRLATTTAAGGNGSDDAADGDGLGGQVPSTEINAATMRTLRDQWFKDDTGAVRDALYIGTESIDSLLDFWEEEFLALGFYFGLTAAGALTLLPLIDLTPTPTVITGKVFVDKIVSWERGYGEAENNVEWSYDHNPGTDKPLRSKDVQDSISITRYGKVKVRKVLSRGARGIVSRAFGMPDLGWDVYMADRACDYLIQYGSPSQSLKLIGFLELQDSEVGDFVQLTHGGIFDLDAKKLGITDGLFYVVGVERKPAKGTVPLMFRQRLATIGRDWFIAPDSIAATYDAASPGDKQFGYIPPDAGNFPDGGAPYDVGI